MPVRAARPAVVLIVLALLVASCVTPTGRAPRGLAAVEHIVVIYAENRSFDHLYGLFPGANGIANATPAQYTQVDRDGRPLPRLPAVWREKEPSPEFPTDLPNRPFRIDAPPINLPLSVPTHDPVHRRYHHGEFTFPMVYAFDERWVLPLSHDEVVHGKGSLLDKMPGDQWQR